MDFLIFLFNDGTTSKVKEIVLCHTLSEDGLSGIDDQMKPGNKNDLNFFVIAYGWGKASQKFKLTRRVIEPVPLCKRRYISAIAVPKYMTWQY